MCILPMHCKLSNRSVGQGVGQCSVKTGKHNCMSSWWYNPVNLQLWYMQCGAVAWH